MSPWGLRDETVLWHGAFEAQAHQSSRGSQELEGLLQEGT
jgi:hypothetical protein